MVKKLSNQQIHLVRSYQDLMSFVMATSLAFCNLKDVVNATTNLSTAMREQLSVEGHHIRECNPDGTVRKLGMSLMEVVHCTKVLDVLTTEYGTFVLQQDDDRTWSWVSQENGVS